MQRLWNASGRGIHRPRFAPARTLAACAALAAALLPAGAASASEAELRGALAICAVMPAPDRFGCFDSLVEREGIVATSPIEAPAWEAAAKTSGFDDSRTLHLSLKSVQPVEGRGGRRYRPVLDISCYKGFTTIHIDYEDFLEAEALDVEYRIDDAPVTKERWSVSEDFKSIGLWKNDGALPMIRRLLDAERLFVRLTPYGQIETVSGFRVRGLRAVSGEMAQVCNWTPQPSAGSGAGTGGEVAAEKHFSGAAGAAKLKK